MPLTVLVASEAPSAAPTPAAPPPAAAAAAAATVALIDALLVAASDTPVVLLTMLVARPFATNASVLPVTILLADAPAPLTEIPAAPPMLAAKDAAQAVEEMLEVSLAESTMLPLVDATLESALMMYTATELVIVF